MFAGTVKVEDVTSTNSNATIQLHSNNFASNLTVRYRHSSEASQFTTLQFSPPVRVVQLEKLDAKTMYYYAITYNESDPKGASTCDGTFTTSSSKGKSTFE